MGSKEKKMAAALAAVTAYMQMEEEAVYEQMVAATAPPKAAKPNYWGLNGRQVMMQMRNLMQMKALQR